MASLKRFEGQVKQSCTLRVCFKIEISVILSFLDVYITWKKQKENDGLRLQFSLKNFAPRPSHCF